MIDSTHDRDGNMDKLNGWQRVWLVACSVSAIAFVYIGYDAFPTDAQIYYRHEQAAHV